MFGLGSRAYSEFCAFGKWLDQQFAQLGGKRLVKLGQGDELCGREEAFVDWLKSCYEVRTSVVIWQPVLEGHWHLQSIRLDYFSGRHVVCGQRLQIQERWLCLAEGPSLPCFNIVNLHNPPQWPALLLLIFNSSFKKGKTICFGMSYWAPASIKFCFPLKSISD